MAYSYLQTIDDGNTATATSIVSASYTLTAGSRVTFVACFAKNTDVSTGCTDTNGNTWDKVGSYANPGGGGMSYSMWECKSVATGGATVITVALSSTATQRGLAGVEISGLSPAAAALSLATNIQTVTAAGTGADTDVITTGNMTPVAAPAAVFGYCQESGQNNLVTAGTGESFFDCPNCSAVNGVSRTFIQLKRATTTTPVASTVTPLAQSAIIYVSIGTVIPEPSTGSVSRRSMSGGFSGLSGGFRG